MPPQPIHPRYIPLHPSSIQTTTSSIPILRTSDQALFLATKIPPVLTKDPKKSTTTTTTQLSSCILPTAAIPLSLILNHPNIISLVDIIQTSSLEGSTSERGPYGDITVWEDMTAGSLSYLLPPTSTYPAFTDHNAWHVLAAQDFKRFSLPESLCWHVLRSISRALLWLHYGIKETEGSGRWVECDEDWQPVLIMDVSPDQIWFKKPKGEEMYGECKLGGFQWARVMQGGGGSVTCQRVEDMPREKMCFWAPEIYNNTHFHSRSTEIWMLGATIYTMMTGIPPPRSEGYDWNVSRMNDKGFSKGLRDIVGDMLKEKQSERPGGAELVERVEGEWKRWRATTEEGQRFVDVMDEVLLNRSLGIGGGW